MGLADRIRAFFGGREKAYRGGGSWADLWARGNEYLLLPEQLQTPFVQVATVHVAVSKIAEALSKIPMVLKRGKTVVDEHPLLEVMRNADPTLYGGQLMYATGVNLCLHGEAFWLPDMESTTLGSRGRGERFPRRIRSLQPNAVSHDVKDGELRQWTVQTEQIRGKFNPEDIVFTRRFNPYHWLRGLSPLAAARVEYNLEYKAGSWNEKFYENGARPSFYVWSPQTQTGVPLAQRADFQKEIEAEYGGLRNAHRVPVMAPGKELRPIGLAQKDMDFLEGRRFSREQILAVFGVPPAVAGVFEYANYANSAEQKRYFWSHTLRPIATLVEESVQAQFIDRWLPGYEFVLDIDAAVEKEIPEDYRERIASAMQLWTIGIPFAALNDKMRLGFDVEGQAHLEVGWMPFGVQPADTALNPPEPEPLEPVDDDKAYRRKAKKRGDWMRYKRRLDTYESAAFRAIVPVLNTAESAVVAQIPKSMTKTASDLIPEDFAQQLQKATDPVLIRVVREGGDLVMAELGRDLEFDATDPNVLGTLTRRRVMIAGASERMRNELREALADAVVKGKSWDEMTQIVHDTFDTFRNNARTIARTETNAAFAESRVQAMAQAGVRKHQWLTATDDFVRASHQMLDGAVAYIGSSEWDANGTLIHTQLRYPHDPQAPAGEVINCRCVTIGLEPEDE